MAIRRRSALGWRNLRRLDFVPSFLTVRLEVKVRSSNNKSYVLLPKAARGLDFILDRIGRHHGVTREFRDCAKFRLDQFLFIAIV